MKMGLLTAPFPQTPLMEVADWAAAHEFEMLEVCAWPQDAGSARRYAGTCHVDVDDLSDARAKRCHELAGMASQLRSRYYPKSVESHPETGAVKSTDEGDQRRLKMGAVV